MVKANLVPAFACKNWVLHTSSSQIYPLLHGTHDQLSLLSRRVSKVTQFFRAALQLFAMSPFGGSYDYRKQKARLAGKVVSSIEVGL